MYETGVGVNENCWFCSPLRHVTGMTSKNCVCPIVTPGNHTGVKQDKNYVLKFLYGTLGGAF